MITEIATSLLTLAIGMGDGDVGTSEYIGSMEYDESKFQQALEDRHRWYDPEERMVRRPHSGGYHYHTRYQGNTVHPTRESLNYAVACLDSGDPELLQRAADILDQVIELQDTDPESRTFGIWSWYMEEPLDEMGAPDFNWADFCGVQLIQVLLRHRERIPTELATRTEQALRNACHSIRRRDVGPGYTNIALMSTYVSLVAAQIFQDESLFDYGRQRLLRFHDYTRHHGGFTEFNSPTYTLVALDEVARMLRDVRDPACLTQIRDIYRLVWTHIGRHFHEPTRQWAGPHSRAYRDLEGIGFQHLIQRATDHQVRFVPEKRIPFDREYALLPVKCPDEARRYFEPLTEPRQEIEIFFNGRDLSPETGRGGELPLVGTTYLHPDFALGTINRGDFWNQRRPITIHFGSPEAPGHARLRCLHDGYDYTSAMFFGVQWQGQALLGVNFATDYGDKHPSLDRVLDATIQAEDLRLRFEFGGALEALELPSDWELGTRAWVRVGDMRIALQVTAAAFDASNLRFETGLTEDRAWLDIVIYEGPERSLRFGEMERAAFGMALCIAGEGEAQPDLEAPAAEWQQDGLMQRWSSADRFLTLNIPYRPAPRAELQRQARAQVGGVDIWEYATPSWR